MPEKLIATIEKNAREVIRVGLTEYGGHNLCNVRVWYKDRETDELKPGKSGLAIRLEKLGPLIDALVALDGEARSLGLLE